MPLPEEIKAAATLGTEQIQVLTFAGVNAALKQLMQQKDGQSLEGQVLTIAFATHLQEKAGWIPPTMKKNNLPLCEPEHLKTCGAKAIRQLLLMLEGYNSKVLSEWLRRVAQSNQRAPEEALPLLLDLGRKRRDLRPLILPVIGKRGVWLGQQVTTQRWDWFEARNIERRWSQGADDTRLELVEALRQDDPAKARQLVEETWQHESEKMRLGFITQFMDGLNESDEAFLENALDDSDQDIRKVAKRLLSKLPRSQFCQRMLKRADGVLALKTARRKSVIQISLLPSADEDMVRDGLSFGKSIDQHELLKRLISHVPINYWCEKWGISDDELLQAAANNRSLLPLLAEAFVWSLSRFPNEYLAKKVFAAMFEVLNLREQQLLLSILPGDFIQANAIAMLHKQEYRAKDTVTSLLEALDDTWSIELGRAWLTSIGRYLSRRNVRPDADTRDRLVEFAYHMPIQLKDEFLVTLDVDTSAKNAWQDAVDEIRLLLDFRQEMLTAIDEGN